MIGGVMRDKDMILSRPRLPSASSPSLASSASQITAAIAAASPLPSPTRSLRLGLGPRTSSSTTITTNNTIIRAMSKRKSKKPEPSIITNTTASSSTNPNNVKTPGKGKGRETNKDKDKYHISPFSRTSSATGSSASLPEFDIVGVVPGQVYQVSAAVEPISLSRRPSTSPATPPATMSRSALNIPSVRRKGSSSLRNFSPVTPQANQDPSSWPTAVIDSPTSPIFSRLSPREVVEHERARRLLIKEHAAMAKARSKEIDEILHDRKKYLDKKKKSIQILLLGQSESGKSSILKNFHLAFAPKKFQAERAVWKIVIQLNIIQSVRNILDILQSEWDPITPSKDEEENLLLLSGDDDYYSSPTRRSHSKKSSISKYRNRRKHGDINEDEDSGLDVDDSLESTLRRRGSTIKEGLHMIQSHPFLVETLNTYKSMFGRLLNLQPILVELFSAEQDQVRMKNGKFGFAGTGTRDVCVRAGSNWRKAIMNMRRGSGMGSFPAVPSASSYGTSSALSPDSVTEMPSISSKVSGSWIKRKKSVSAPTPKLPSLAYEQEQLAKKRNPNDPTMVLAASRDDLTKFWEDGKVQSVLERRGVRMMHSSGFFLHDIARIAQPDYAPTDEDIVRARVRTLGVEEHHLVIEKGIDAGADVYITDVGGSRSARPAWVPFFQDVQAIFFLAPLAFNETLEEDPRVNRLEDSLFLWREICANKLLANAQIILFLNKKDILEATLKAGVQVRQYVPNYYHANDVPSVTKYFKTKFQTYMKRVSPKQRGFMCYETSAVDTSAMAALLVGVREVILRQHLQEIEVI